MSPSNILIVEDQAIFARSLRRTLEAKMGAPSIVVADTVARAVAALAEAPPDLVMLDLGLPDGSGFDVLEACQRLPKRPRVVVVTVFDDDHHLFRALRRGVDGYVLKEESGDELVRLIQEVLADRPPLSASIARRVIQHFAGAVEPPTEPLTERETTILQLLAKGCTVAEAARHLEISPHTVQHHVKGLYRKLEVHSRAEMTRAAVDLGIV